MDATDCVLSLAQNPCDLLQTDIISMNNLALSRVFRYRKGKHKDAFKHIMNYSGKDNFPFFSMNCFHGNFAKPHF